MALLRGSFTSLKTFTFGDFGSFFCGGAAGISGTLVELYSLLKQMEEFPNVAFF